MKRPVLIVIILLLLSRSFCQDYRILQADKAKLFVSTTHIDNIIQVVIINADWRLDYVEKNANINPLTGYSAVRDLGIVSQQKDYTSPTDHRGKDKLTRTFYIEISPATDVNAIFTKVNAEYRALAKSADDYNLIRNFLPDSAAEYCVHGYRGNSSAALEVLYLWGAPMRDWSVGFTLSVHDREARKVLGSLSCMPPTDTELPTRKIRIAQASILSIMSYVEMFCQ